MFAVLFFASKVMVFQHVGTLHATDRFTQLTVVSDTDTMILSKMLADKRKELSESSAHKKSNLSKNVKCYEHKYVII